VRGKDGGVEGVEVGPKGGVVPIGGPVGGGPDRKGMRWGVLNEELVCCWWMFWWCRTPLVGDSVGFPALGAAEGGGGPPPPPLPLPELLLLLLFLELSLAPLLLLLPFLLEEVPLTSPPPPLESLSSSSIFPFEESDLLTLSFLSVADFLSFLSFLGLGLNSVMTTVKSLTVTLW